MPSQLLGEVVQPLSPADAAILGFRLDRQSTVPAFAEGDAREPEALDAPGTREAVMVDLGRE
jgi:hypothetical protein